MRNWLVCFVILALAAQPLVRAEAQEVTIRADRALRGVPRHLLGANFTSYGKSGTSPADFAPCCLGPLGQLARPLALWRTPGGILGSFFHFLTGTYGDDPDGPPNGVTLDAFVKAATDHGGELLHILNWNASDQELLNLIEYANGPVPHPVDPNWTRNSFRQQDPAPRGYFPWLRQLRGRRAPMDLRYVALGNEIWNSFNDRDVRCSHDAACYGQKGAELARRLKAQDPRLQIGVSILTLGQEANPGYRNSAVYAGWRAAGLHPDFVSDHGYVRCGYGPRTAAQAEELVRFADRLGPAAQRTRAELVAAFPECGPYIGLFLDEFGPQACAAGPEPFETFGPWAAAAVAHVYAAALHAGYSHVSYYAWNGSPREPDEAGYGLVNGEAPGTVDAAYWGLWLAARLLASAVSELEIAGLPAELRGVAVHAPGLVRLLLLNTSATTARQLRVRLEGREALGATALLYGSGPEHGTLQSPFSRRSQVPQQQPPPRPQRLDAVTVPPLATVLLEIDVGAALPPPARAVATGCADEEIAAQPPDLAPGDDPTEAPPVGCGCRIGGGQGPRRAAAWALLLLGGLALRGRKRRKAVITWERAPFQTEPARDGPGS